LLVFVIISTRSGSGARCCVSILRIVSIGSSCDLIPSTSDHICSVGGKDGAEDGVCWVCVVDDDVSAGGVDGAVVFEGAGAFLGWSGEGFVGDNLDGASGCCFDGRASVDDDVVVGS
jgi:hypothetical protein